MAVNTITFGGVNSSSYGIYISGEGVFNAPVRDAEVISIPGRNGSFLLDNGRYENIEVRYPAFNTATDKATFIANIDGFRNAIASQKGYQRLEDTFHADEYRMASFIGGLEINPILYNDHTSQFEIVFNCKPQRFLKTGETATSYARNSTISNSTLFDSHPLLQFNSSGSDGTISLGTQTLTVKSALVGVTPLNLTSASTTISGYTLADIVTINNTSSYNSGDTITFSGAEATFKFKRLNSADNIAYTNATGFNSPTIVNTTRESSVTLKATDMPTFTAGTSATHTKTATITVRTSFNQVIETATITLDIIYNGSNTITVRWQLPSFSNLSLKTATDNAIYSGTVDSSKNTLQNVTIYIDLDIGEAYSIDSNNNVVSLNNFVNIGGELPTLPPGNTTITYSTSISNFKITPRWYKI